MSSRTIHNVTYRMVMQPPPGKVVAPNGFPAEPRPKHAPKTFLDAMEIRIKVFCEEQKCDIGPELDEDDPRSWSWVIYQCSNTTTNGEVENGGGLDKPVSTVRIVPPPHAPHPNGFHDPDEEPYVKLTRVATLMDARGNGLSRWLCDEAFAYLGEHVDEVGSGWKGIVLTHAQVGIEGMYEKMGFVEDERLGRWEEERIEHLGMWKRIDLTG